MLKKPDFIEKIAENINRTRSAKELEPSSSSPALCVGVTDEDLENIVVTTQNDPFFEELLNEIINEHLMNPPHDSEVQASTSDRNSDSIPLDVEIPIKQRLRPRSERKTTGSERKNKVKILSDVPYTGVVPAIANLPVTTSVLPAQTAEFPQVLLMSTGVQVSPVVPSTSSSIISNSVIKSQVTSTAMVYDSTIQTEASIVLPVVVTTESESVQTEAEKNETTPKITLYPSYLESRCKSTPRRKATHVRILNFNQTPSNRRLLAVKEFSTPATGILAITPGSAPANMVSFTSTVKTEEVNIQNYIVDENSNSNSISNTPKVVKNRRRRKIADAKSEDKSKSKEEEFTNDDWMKMRMQSKNLPIDQQQRLINAEAESKTTKRRRTSQRRDLKKQIATKKKSKGKSPEEQKENKKEKNRKSKSLSSTEYDENKPLSSMKFKIASPRKIAAMKNTWKNISKKKKKSIIHRSKEKFNAQEVQTMPKSTELPEATENRTEVSVELNRSDTVQEVANMLTNLSEAILASNSITKTVDTAGDITTRTETADGEAKEQVDSGIEKTPLLETPFKEINETSFEELFPSPLPNTPRFAIPLVSSSQETPMPKIFASTNTMSLIKNCDILTPSFPITPGLKETPLKDIAERSPAASGEYSTRRTDYSSCSSYYKPDESEEINQNINAFINQRRSERASQSESDGGGDKVETQLKSREDMQKVECPGAIERVKSFTEVKAELPTPHYTMMNNGIPDTVEDAISESFVTTATEDSSSSSSFTCSTCSTDSSECEDTMQKLNKAVTTEEKDSEWDFDDPNVAKESIISPAVINEKTGEVRFPLRNWITPKKVDNNQTEMKESKVVQLDSSAKVREHHMEVKEKIHMHNWTAPKKVEIDKEQAKIEETNKIKALLSVNDPRRGLSVDEERERYRQEMEGKKRRTLEILRGKSKADEPKFKKANVKNFKLPADNVSKPVMVNRRDQILHQHLTSRPRPTPLMLAPSSRRKNATPRKTIVIDELPHQQSPHKKKKVIRPNMHVKSPAKTELSMELVSDNAVMPEMSLLSLGLDMSSSFNTSNEETEPTAITVVANKTPSKPVVAEEGSNTFQQAMIEQGFDKQEAKELQSKLLDNIEEVQTVQLADESPAEPENQSVTEDMLADGCQEKTSSSGSESEDDESGDEELEVCLAEENEKNVFHFTEQENFMPCKKSDEPAKILSLVIRLEDRVMRMTDSENIELFSMKPEPKQSKKNPKKTANDDKKNDKESPSKNGKSKATKKSSFQSSSVELPEK